MDTELADRIDRSIGPAPESDDELAGLLAAGHGAVRRRRAATIAGAVAAVLVVAGGVAVAAGGSPDRATTPVGEPTSTPTGSTPSSPAASATAAAAPEWEGGDDLALYDLRTGELLINPAATVLQQVDNPFDVASPAQSVGLVLETGGKRYWYALYYDLGGGSAAATPASAEHRPFRAWLADMSGIVPTDDETADQPQGDFPGFPADDLVTLVAGTERLAPSDGVTILEQRAGVDVGESFAAPEDRTAAARVRNRDGTIVYVLARAVDGRPVQVIGVTEADGGSDLDEFLAFARERYAEGGGGLL